MISSKNDEEGELSNTSRWSMGEGAGVLSYGNADGGARVSDKDPSCNSYVGIQYARRMTIKEAMTGPIPEEDEAHHS